MAFGSSTLPPFPSSSRATKSISYSTLSYLLLFLLKISRHWNAYSEIERRRLDEHPILNVRLLSWGQIESGGLIETLGREVSILNKVILLMLEGNIK